jgi:hypothetical protein
VMTRVAAIGLSLGGHGRAGVVLMAHGS